MKLMQMLREQRKLSRFGLCRISGVDPARYGQLELGRYIPPENSVLLERIAAALDFAEDPVRLLEDVPVEARRSPDSADAA